MYTEDGVRRTDALLMHTSLDSRCGTGLRRNCQKIARMVKLPFSRVSKLLLSGWMPSLAATCWRACLAVAGCTYDSALAPM